MIVTFNSLMELSAEKVGDEEGRSLNRKAAMKKPFFDSENLNVDVWIVPSKCIE
jgi:hypothetical protein